ncbi:phosphodiester glycosidase family protein [Demequina sp. TTPB684]|uniref:phosphodiester glycosidase family protein n=1 Tax=unclassified Demequina TaxID=2620311 RepID=UPI001CF11758|nr:MULTISPECIES: phosphodiester glycosidase family protein [unclassified Demequina]MCB2413051.1 phosphodiester glycosidase family protein [Demequina sp. TTPB684]UPU89468.1 phosphodiester glycosidase family protein [Demequina sp. TMPB413]
MRTSMSPRGLGRTLKAALAVVVLGAVLAACTSPDGPPVIVVTVPAPASSTPAASPSPTAQQPTQADAAVDVRIVEHQGNRYEVVALPLEQWDVRVDWDPDAGGVMLADVLAADPDIAVATNAGIFTPVFAPGGLLVSDGVTLVDLNLADGGGNFHLKPNAVFQIADDGTAAVVESSQYTGEGVRHATQSGPALLLDGQVHPEFREGSTNLAFRSGVGVSPDGATVYLALSWTLTNLHDFATLFRDQLGCEDALYLDGQISRLWVAGDGEPDVFAGPFAGMITARPTGTSG